jgi:perosamine synthetase
MEVFEMYKKDISRRGFLKKTTAGSAAVFAFGAIPKLGTTSNATKPALLGGLPVRMKPFPSWPIVDSKDEESVLSALRSREWSRGKSVSVVEERFAKMMGSRYCIITGSGTQSLNASIHVLGIGAGDEVLTTPYTFVATIDAILLEDALPVFIDIDPETFQIDADKIEAKITEHTKAILPVHINGGVSHMDKINTTAKKHNLRVVEDACQAVLAEWKGRKVGTLSDLGCLSFQNSKNLTCGEGGAILGNDEEIIDRCYSFHNFGRPKGRFMSREKGGHPILGTKYRISSIHAALLNAQMDRIEDQTRLRSQNADYLTSRLKEIPGIVPRKDYPETTRTAYYAYTLRYKKEHFNNLPRKRFLSALKAEGIPCSWGVGVLEGLPLHREGLIEQTLSSTTFQKIYSKERLNKYREDNHCPESDLLADEVMGFPGRLFLGSRQEMDDVVNAIVKIYENRIALL